jgi:hypothetical protein
MFETIVARYESAQLKKSGSGDAEVGTRGKNNSRLLDDTADIQDKTEAGLNRIDATIEVCFCDVLLLFFFSSLLSIQTNHQLLTPTLVRIATFQTLELFDDSMNRKRK